MTFNSIFILSILVRISQICNNKQYQLCFNQELKIWKNWIKLVQIWQKYKQQQFCLVDISNSMQGQKILVVQDILQTILSNLREQDRLCLISFNNEGKLLTGLQKVTEETKEYFQFIIEGLACTGTTQLWKATDIAFDVISQRKNQCNWARILIFTDGQDEIALTKIKKQLEFNIDVFTIDTFGFGNANANKRLTAIANLRYGQHYTLVDETYILNYLEQVFANFPFNAWEDVTLTITSNNLNGVYDQINISEIHNDGWIEVQPEQQYKINIPNLEIGESFLFSVEMSLLKFNNNIVDKAKPISILKGKVESKNSLTGKKAIKNVELDVLFIFENEANTLDFNTYFNCKQSPLIIWVCDEKQTCKNMYNDQNLIENHILN
ncbi:hypothetical protein FGO68_gene4528 [Halteria grandinella]|uniref:VWFA domain-containing protein n=1 Tax=Halteria grandinella TaxID=5974 RepID=A0A8J8NGX4_HALGN|nr:hypothetical protein FGO68_gene4528 [Halteria grandinella]